MAIETSIPQIFGNDLDLSRELPDRSCALIVEDDPDTLFLLKNILRRSEFDVCGAMDGIQAVQKCQVTNPDVILLDIMLPDHDGWTTYHNLRQITPAPIMIVSALAEKEDVIHGLSIGAEDYVTKPFHNEELVIRLQNVMRRTHKHSSHNELIFPQQALRIDLQLGVLHYGNREIILASKEASLIELLARNAPAPVDYLTITKNLWGQSNNAQILNNIRCLVHHLRRKIETNPAEPKLLLTHKRLGYRLAVD
jgi:two-component system, OmpR family, KDP operon response regulator KdpE